MTDTSARPLSTDETMELEFRALSQAERIILAGLVGVTPAWQELRGLAVRFGKTIVVGVGADISKGFLRGAATPNGSCSATVVLSPHRAGVKR